MRRTMMLTLSLLVTAPSFGAGLLQPKDGSAPPLQIRDHAVRVVINNGFAVTEIDQVFHNPYDRDLEAIYTFPLPKDASLSELSLWVDGEELIGEVVEKERGRDIYEKERREGRETTIAEKNDYYSFDVFVSPVRAGSDTRVRLVYLQPLEIDAGVGRYVYPLEEGNVDDEAVAFWEVQTRVHGRFVFEGTIRSAYPLEAVRVKGYQDLAKVAQVAPDTWEVWIDSEEEVGSRALDQDVVIYFRLAENTPARVDLLPFRAGDGPGTFLLVVTPGVDLKRIAEGVDWSIVLDVSGSMSGKIQVAADGVARSLSQMRPEDRFRILAFSDKPRLIQDWTPVAPHSIVQAGERLRSLRSGGGTNVHAAFIAGLTDLEFERTSAMVLVSDGGANVGPTEHEAFLDVLENRDVRVFTFVMGQGANVPLLERLAKSSGGFSMGISNQDDLYGRILQAREKLAREAMHGVRLDVDGIPVEDVVPATIPSVYFGQQIRMLGRYPAPGTATLRLRALISGEERTWEVPIVLPERDETYPELERIWALARIQDLQETMDARGEKPRLRQAVVELGTTYSIVTDQTSMVVVRKERQEDYGLDDRNRKRTEKERDAREIRMQQMAPATRVDSAKPMFAGQPAHRTSGGGGGFGGGALGPEFLGLLGLLLGIRRWACRRRDRR